MFNRVYNSYYATSWLPFVTLVPCENLTIMSGVYVPGYGTEKHRNAVGAMKCIADKKKT